jgi:hypothetical protein
MGTGTVTDVTSAVSATNTTGAIASLAITPIAATNTSVTYTNASTLYIAGAPSAGTNITITNPYALYVAAGASYLGGNTAVTGTLTITGTAATNTTALTAGSTTTGFNRGRITNTGGDIRFGIDSSVGSEAVANSAAYSSFIGSFTSTPLYLVSNSAIAATIDTSGNLGIGNTSPTSYNSAADNLVIGTSGNNGMTIVSGSTSSGYIMFADGTTGQQQYEGQITYDHTSNFMAFNTSGTERMRISSTGLTVTLGATIQGLTVGLGNASASATSTAVGISALASSTGADATAFGYFAGENLSSGAYSIAIGSRAMGGTTGGPNTGSYNTAIGNSSLAQNTSGNRNIAIGNEALGANQGGTSNVAIGSYQAAGGDAVLSLNVSGNYNTAVGAAALAKTTASNNTAVGYQAGFTNSAGQNLVAIGYQAGYTSNANNSTYVGYFAGQETTGTLNTFLGVNGVGYKVTTGTKNVIIGGYSGLAAPIIQTGSNYIVLSDGDGNVGFSTVKAGGNQYSWALPGASNYQGIGITFPATQSASTDANTLDDYEEGTWTPLMSANGGGSDNWTSSTATGRYTKIGRLVSIQCTYTYTAKQTLTGDYAWMTGFPFTPSAAIGYFYVGINNAGGADTATYSGFIFTSGIIGFNKDQNLSSPGYMVGSDFPAATRTITFQAMYIV